MLQKMENGILQKNDKEKILSQKEEMSWENRKKDLCQRRGHASMLSNISMCGHLRNNDDDNNDDSNNVTPVATLLRW